MILWINLVTDGGPALALSMDPPQKDLMDKPPRDPNEGILHGRFASILMSFITQFLGTGVLFFIMFYVVGDGVVGSSDFDRARTMAFVQATLRELMVVWNCRSERKNAFRVGFTSNKWLLIAVVVSGAVTMLVPYMGLFGTIPLGLNDWLIVIPLSLSGLLILPEIFYNRKIWRWR